MSVWAYPFFRTFTFALKDSAAAIPDSEPVPQDCHRGHADRGFPLRPSPRDAQPDPNPRTIPPGEAPPSQYAGHRLSRGRNPATRIRDTAQPAEIRPSQCGH